MTFEELETLRDLLMKFSTTYHVCYTTMNCRVCSYRSECDNILGAIAAVVEKKNIAKIEEN